MTEEERDIYVKNLLDENPDYSKYKDSLDAQKITSQRKEVSQREEAVGALGNIAGVIFGLMR